MEVLAMIATFILGVLTLALIYVAYMSRKFLTFKKMGIPALTPLPAFGNLLDLFKIGVFEFHKTNYAKFASEKVYGMYEPGQALMMVRDLDMIKDIMVKNFNSFVNRRVFSRQKPFDKMLTVIEDDHWRHVRNAVSPTFSTGKLKQMSLHVERTAQNLVANIHESCKKEEDVELKDIMSCYTMDVIASSGFGVSIDSLKDRSCEFLKNAKELMNFGGKAFFVTLMFPFVNKILEKFGIGLFPMKPVRFFSSFIDAALKSRTEEEGEKTKRNDFIQLVINERKKQENTHEGNGKSSDGKYTGLTNEEIEGQGIILLLAGYETVSTALSFTLFALANNPEVCRKLQEEIDVTTGGKFPNYEFAQSMQYLDMCLNEGMRMYPPGFIIDRICNEDCTIQGVRIPKGQTVAFPVVGIHYDHHIFPDPETFDPERFSQKNRDSRHPFAHLPFGQGPRNCIAMRLALLEMKVALAAVLQVMTPVPCDKTVYPPKIMKLQIKAEDGCWVKFIERKD